MSSVNRLPVAPPLTDDVFERAASRLSRSVLHNERPQAAPVIPVYKEFDEAPDWPQDRIVREFGRVAQARNKFVQLPPQEVTAGFNNMLAELTGTGGKERVQLWPERMARSALALPRDVITGAEPIGQTGDRFSPHVIERAQEVAGLSGGAPLMAKPGSATLGSGAVRAGAKEVKPAEPFYSAVEAAVRDAPDAKMTPEQWGGYLRNRPGVKAEELDWIGLPEGQKISKQEMLDHAKEHGVQMKEVRKQGETTLNEEAAFDRALEEVPRRRGEDEDAWMDRVHDHAYDLMDETGVASGPKFSEYQLPGGDNYREVLFTLPERNRAQGYRIEDNGDGTFPYKVIDAQGNKVEGMGPYTDRRYAEEDIAKLTGKPSDNYQSYHWDEPNVLAHARVNDRTVPDVGKTLHLEEIQSDWHQQGRKEGYRSQDRDKLPDGYTIKTEGFTSKVYDKNGYSVAVGDSPEAAIKAALEKIDTSSDTMRFDKSRQVPDAPFKTSWPDLVLKRMIREAAENGYDAVSWTPGEAQAARYDLSKQIKDLRYARNSDGTYNLGANRDPDTWTEIHIGENIPAAKLADHVGKDVAERIIQGKGDPSKSGVGRILTGVDLKVGGEGMKGFYDDMLVRKANALGKKYGAKVEWKEINSGPNEKVYRDAERSGDSAAIADALGKPLKVPVFRLTSGLRDVAMRKGFPLFSAGSPFPLIPVDHDPFKESK